jgi:hypothetical protein
MKIKTFLLIVIALPTLLLGQEPLSQNSFLASGQENKWVSPPPATDSDREIKFLLQADYQQDADLQGQAFSMFDLSAKRSLDENSVLADGLIRIRKSLSSSDTASEVDLRLAKLSYMDPAFQVSVGRFDLFQMLTSNSFFGAYPIMGIHRVDGVMATIPISLFLGFGDTKNTQAQGSSPLALSFFYTPSLFSAQQVQEDSTQAFGLGQLRCRINSSDFDLTIKANVGVSATDYFDYSSLNGGPAASLAADMDLHQHIDLTAEYGVQNTSLFNDTSALSLGFKTEQLGTWGAFSIDQFILEAQVPMGKSLDNPFTGGNGFIPDQAQSPQTSWYAKLKTRIKGLFLEFHATNNQNDFTLDRLVPSAIGVPFNGGFGPGNETDGPGTGLRSNAYNRIAFLVRTGVEF